MKLNEDKNSNSYYFWKDIDFWILMIIVFCAIGCGASFMSAYKDEQMKRFRQEAVEEGHMILNQDGSYTWRELHKLE